MAQDLPDDVWSQLAETWLDQGALENMSLTSRRMHRFVVPVLFRDLEFHCVFRVASESFMATLIRNITRARFLSDSPELLRYTRSFTFSECGYAVDSIANCLALHQGSDSSSVRGDAENFVAVLHDALFCLIFRMPGLREIEIGDTLITPLCYAAVSSRPLLTSLTLALPRMRLPDNTHINPTLPRTFRLRDFAYFDNWMGNVRPADPYLADILHRFIFDLEKLSISSSLLSFVASRIPSHRTLSIRDLSVGFPDDPESSESLAVAAFWNVLRACPQLQHLEVWGRLRGISPEDCLPSPCLPNLTNFSGSSYFLQLLSGGTNLVKVDIYERFDVKKRSLTQVIPSPPTHLRELSMEFVVFSAQKPNKFLTFIRTLSVFRNLESLRMAYEHEISWKESLRMAYEHEISWKDHVSAQESHNTIKNLLNQLTCLRFIDIHSFSGAKGSYDIGCPISKPGEPGDRGHPSLEGIYVDFICGMWSWNSWTGWVRSNWAMP